MGSRVVMSVQLPSGDRAEPGGGVPSGVPGPRPGGSPFPDADGMASPVTETGGWNPPPIDLEMLTKLTKFDLDTVLQAVDMEAELGGLVELRPVLSLWAEVSALQGALKVGGHGSVGVGLSDIPPPPIQIDNRNVMPSVSRSVVFQSVMEHLGCHAVFEDGAFKTAEVVALVVEVTDSIMAGIEAGA